ncbi:hypothetical protein GDO81_027348 [Engystomops pustulosus]|uniref:Uncharacterized protein n=1 Tax=Engystomops pustulosus TaxID=76066 RepID=A0AAV6ZF92_ENGPU|nr:hypothetical protein GDO81_027348 [Engystomops pustulosus]
MDPNRADFACVLYWVKSKCLISHYICCWGKTGEPIRIGQCGQYPFNINGQIYYVSCEVLVFVFAQLNPGPVSKLLTTRS